MSTVVVDPITRIEGHLRIEAETDKSGRIKSALSSGTMMRGIEIILRGRDPREAWAFTQRICGVCTVVHALTSVRAVEDALGYRIPPNARHIRNILMGSQLVQDQVTHFYQLTSLDWVNVVSASQADPRAASELQKCLSSWPNNSRDYFEAVRRKLADFIATGQLGLFTGYWDHPGYTLPPELNLVLFAHWMEALEWQRKVLRVHAVLGGRNPHPNFAVGGVPLALNMAPDANGVLRPARGTSGLDQAGLDLIQASLTEMRDFVARVLRPDVLALARHYRDWFKRGEGLGNFLTFGEYPESDGDPSADLFVPRGAILGRKLNNVMPVNLADPAEVQEYVPHSWLGYAAGKHVGLHPFQGETTPDYTGPRAAYDNLDKEQAYSWLKTPHWRGNPMEVGPLARILVMYGKGNGAVREHVDQALRDLDQPFSAMYSTMGRILAQSIDTQVVADRLQVWFNQLTANIGAGDFRTHDASKFDPATWPATARGVGFTEAPRGALGHWLVIDNGAIANYQAVVPTTWNAAPRDNQGQGGAYEMALADNHRLAVADQPLEILRTIHSFNPCMACAVHLMDAMHNETLRVSVRV